MTDEPQNVNTRAVGSGRLKKRRPIVGISGCRSEEDIAHEMSRAAASGQPVKTIQGKNLKKFKN